MPVDPLLYSDNDLFDMPSQEPSSQTHNSATPDQMPNGTNPVNNPAGDKPRTPD